MTDIDALVAEARDRLQSAADDVKRFDHGEFDNGIMAEIRTENVEFFQAVVTALSALTTERARVVQLEAFRNGYKDYIRKLQDSAEAERAKVAALEAEVARWREAKAEPVATMPPDEWVRDYAKKHCAVKTGDHWKADAWNLKCAFRAWAEASPPAPEMP
jgi:hypothetical protein